MIKNSARGKDQWVSIRFFINLEFGSKTTVFG
jgi:hypothetical protein